MAQLDKERWLARLMAANTDPMALRLGLLDLCFAAGQGVREQAVALADGDALCLTSSPADPPARDVVVVDLVPPQLPGQPPVTWPTGWRGLGGPPALAALVGVLAALPPDRPPTRVRYVRVPATGANDYLPELLQNAAPELHVVQPCEQVPNPAAALWSLRVTASRPRNIWRFPACDHGFLLQLTGPQGQTLAALQRWLGGLPGQVVTTVHDLRVAPAANGLETLRTAIRSSVPVEVPASQGASLHWQVGPLHAQQRLLYPVGDALAGLRQHPPALLDWLGSALVQPLAVDTQPDGLALLTLVEQAPDTVLHTTLADDTRAAGLRWTWLADEIAVLRTTHAEAVGPVPVAAGLPQTARVWPVTWSPEAPDACSVAIVQHASFAVAQFG